MAIQIGKYKRPGIFIEEFDKSIIATPQSIDQLTNLVLGVSKRGPVNAPVKVSTLNEFEAIFGEIDRNLERRGSFFHRTVEKMLESSPVYAMNLLLTNDNLDRVEYQTLSTSSNTLNDSKRLGAYRRFHDTTGFWKKDTESFINLTRANTGYGQRALNITNLSDRPVSVFIYKSIVSDFDVTAESWFGSKKPGYINSNDFISDYMVDVVVVDGDWSDYRALAQDKIWSDYFFYDEKLGSGIRKNLVLDFMQNRNVKVLGYYEGLSLIPYFRDSNNKNLFIETNLNRDTDKTGIFCSYNIDLVETDGPNALIDLVGHTIAAKNQTSIDFLSYQANISEEIKFEVKPLDLPGNVTANLSKGITFSGTTVRIISDRSTTDIPYKFLSTFDNNYHFYATSSTLPTNILSSTFSGVQTNYKNRTAHFADDNIYGVQYVTNTFDDNNQVSGVYGTANSLTFEYKVDASAFAIINGEYKSVVLNSIVDVNNFKEHKLTLNVSDYNTLAATQSYMAVVYFDYETSEIMINSPINPVGSSTAFSITPKDIVLNTFKFKIKKDLTTGQNNFVDFNAWNIYYDSNNQISSKLGPIYTSGYNGPWSVVQPSGSFLSGWGHWLNNVTGFEPNGNIYLSGVVSSEPVHVDTSFLNKTSSVKNNLLHDNTHFIETFYKNDLSKRYLFGDSEAVIATSSWTGNLTSTLGYVYDARMFSYANNEKFNYAQLSPIFATGSSYSVALGTFSTPGKCKFRIDINTKQLYAIKDTLSNWNTNISSLSKGDLVSVWGLSASNSLKDTILASASSVNAFNYTGTTPAPAPILLIVDKIIDNDKIYFLNNNSTIFDAAVVIDASKKSYTLEKVNHDLFDYRVTYEGDGKIKYTFLNTDNSPNISNYRSYRRHKMFTKLVSILNSADKDKRVLVLNGDVSNAKVSMAGMFLSNITISTTQNKSFILNTNLPNSEFVKSDWQKVLQGFLCIYTVDDEVILGRNGMDTKMIGLTSSVTATDPLIGDGIGVVSKYSNLYQQYYDGYINNGDYFQNNRTPSDVWKTTEGYTVTFFDGEEDKAITGLNTGKTTLFAGYNYIMFTASFPNTPTGVKSNPNFAFGDMITIKQSNINKKRITILSGNEASITPNSNIQFTDANGLVLDTLVGNDQSKLYIYKIAEEIAYEKITGVKDLLDHMPASGFNYLNMFIDNKVEADGKLVNNSLSIRFKTGYDLLTSMPVLSNLDSLNKFYITSQSSNYKQTLEVEGVPPGVDNQVLVKGDRYSELKIGDYLLSTNNRLVRIIDKRIYNNDTTLVSVTCNGPIKKTNFGSDIQTYLYKSVDNYTYAYKALTFRGFKVRTASLPDGTELTQNNILDTISKGTPLFRALTNKEAIDYRYLVDSFGLGLGERSKQQLADICGSRKDIFGFLNMPSIRSFKQSSSPTFLDVNGDLNVEFIAKGSNTDKAASFTYTFADGEGSTCVGYFTPYIQVDDNGRQLSMPPASHVATTYMRKHTSNLGGITPWTIAAGVTNGRITNIIGLEHNYSNDDIEFLNQAQMNPIVFKRNRGNVIETENTAQTLYKSALSYIHVREVLIELERELSRMLLDFQWRYNTAEIRAEIKLRADVICETYVSRNGLYNYFNKMDDENNTSEIIDNQIGVLDTYVEPIKGMGIIVNNVTILRTGAIEAGGFL